VTHVIFIHKIIQIFVNTTYQSIRLINFLIIFLQDRFYPDVEFYDEKSREKHLPRKKYIMWKNFYLIKYTLKLNWNFRNNDAGGFERSCFPSDVSLWTK